MADVLVDTDVFVDAKSVAPEKPVEGLRISNVTGTCKSGITLNNVKGATFQNIQVTGVDGSRIQLP